MVLNFSSQIKFYKMFIASIAIVTFLFLNLSAQSIRSAENNAFTFGERLDYKVGYSFITAGRGYFQIMPKISNVNDRKCYDIKFRVFSLESLKWIYQVDDAYSTQLDVDALLPWKFQQRIREGKYKKDAKIDFDQYKNTAYDGDKTYKVPKDIYDIVSAFFYVRTLNLKNMKNGTIFYLQNFFDGKVNKLGVKIHKRETISVEAGTFETIKIEPLVVKGGLFQSEGNIFIWLTDDENKMPVKVSTKILIGDVYAELTKYSGLKNPVEARKR